MAVCRVEKNKNYTTMSNFHLRDPNLSNKARGLLSTMLSLPEDWDYTTRGLAKICKDGVDGITAQLKELEKYGYLIRHRIRDSNGRIVDMEYVIYERPHTASPDRIVCRAYYINKFCTCYSDCYATVNRLYWNYHFL